MDRGASTSTSVKQDELSMATSQLSLSKSPSLMQKGSKKKRVQMKPSSSKSKGKRITSSKPKKSESSKRKRIQVNELYECDEDYYAVKERAGKLLLSLENDLADVPGFGKRMLPSNVTYSFWMTVHAILDAISIMSHPETVSRILPVDFCKSHLPNHDTTITLVDESGEEFKMNFLLARHGLSAGWRGFSIGHRLIKGDILLFHLVEPCKFKVHIVRVHSLDTIEAAVCLMKIDAKEKASASASAKGKTHKNATKDTKANKKRKNIWRPSPWMLVHLKQKLKTMAKKYWMLTCVVEQSNLEVAVIATAIKTMKVLSSRIIHIPMNSLVLEICVIAKFIVKRASSVAEVGLLHELFVWAIDPKQDEDERPAHVVA